MLSNWNTFVYNNFTEQFDYIRGFPAICIFPFNSCMFELSKSWDWKIPLGLFNICMEMGRKWMDHLFRDEKEVDDFQELFKLLWGINFDTFVIIPH